MELEASQAFTWLNFWKNLQKIESWFELDEDEDEMFSM